MKAIYLAGLISTEKSESLQWRHKAIARLCPSFNVLTPMRGKNNLKAESKDGGISSEVNTAKDIILRDYNDVMAADIVLVNLNQWGSERPLLGTIYELAWVWEHKKRCMAICDPDNYLMKNHPFVKETVGHYFNTLDEACTFIETQQ